MNDVTREEEAAALGGVQAMVQVASCGVGHRDAYSVTFALLSSQPAFLLTYPLLRPDEDGFTLHSVQGFSTPLDMPVPYKSCAGWEVILSTTE